MPTVSYPQIYSGAGTQTPVSQTNMTTTMNAPTSVTINAIDTNNALRTLQTNLRPASRNYDRSIGNRPSTAIGSKRGT